MSDHFLHADTSRASTSPPVLSPGKITFDIQLSDAAGNKGYQAIAYATLNATAPPAFSIAESPATINAATAKNTGFTFTGAELQDTYHL